MTSTKATTEGVAEAWTHWLDQHPISVPEHIQAGIERAARAWMDANTDRIAAATAQALARHIRVEGVTAPGTGLTPEQRRALLDAVNNLRDTVEAGFAKVNATLDTLTRKEA